MLASIGYESLFEMLAAGRFDAFPRGLNEVGSEMKEQLPRYPGLTLEKTKAIYFPFPVYFWVSKQNTPLAKRVLQGLKLAERDGSFKALFLRHHAEAIQLLATMAGKPRRSPIPNCRPAMPNRIPAGGGSGAEWFHRLHPQHEARKGLFLWPRSTVPGRPCTPLIDNSW
jgi:hypothetical protein